MNGYAICIKDDKLGYLDVNGKQVIKNQFEEYLDCGLLGNFINGRAVAVKDKKYGLIDTLGHFVISPKYDVIKSFGSYYGIQKNDKWAILDSVFNLVSDDDFESLDLINHRFILFRKNGKVGLMDFNLNVILNALYISIMQQDDYFIVSNESGNALINQKGTQIVPSNSWLIYSVDLNFLGVIDETSGVVIQYIDKATEAVINKP